MAPDLDDRLLVQRARDGDRQAFGDLVSRYAMIVHGLCTGVVGRESTPEVAHDAFVEAWLKLSSLRDPGRFAPWLRTLTLNLCRQWHRRRQRVRSTTAHVDLDDLPGDGGGDADALDSLCLGLARLSRDHRLTLALHYEQGLSYEQIAAFLDVPMGTVMSRLHRARSDLRKRMEEMSQTDGEDDETGAGGFREAVDAEIEVLLCLWEEESVDLRGRFFSTAGKRLSLLVQNSPDMMRPALASMGHALTRHAALLLRRAGGRAIGVAVACAFADDPDLRYNARRVLTQVLGRDADQSLSDNYKRLPLRLTVTWVLDAVIRSAQTDADKAALLVDLLPGCEDEASLILMAAVLRVYSEHTFPLLLARWQAARGATAVAIFVGALSRFGTPFLVALTEAMAAPDATDLRRTLAATKAAADLVVGAALGRDPALERRTRGHLVREELDDGVLGDLCARLEALVAHVDADVRDPAIAILGHFGDGRHAAVLRPCLQSPHASTRQAAIVGVRALGDRGSVPELMRLARDDEPAVRRVALQTLGHLGAREARELLVELVDDAVARPHAISALGEISDDGARAMLQNLTKGPDKKVARMAANALYGGTHTPQPPSDLQRERLAKIRGADARPLMHTSVVAAIRHLPEARPYPEAELTRLIGEVCIDYSTTRRELVMGNPGLMVRHEGIYEFSDMGLAVWRLERFLRDRDELLPAGPGGALMAALPILN